MHIKPLLKRDLHYVEFQFEYGCISVKHKYCVCFFVVGGACVCVCGGVGAGEVVVGGGGGVFKVKYICLCKVINYN